jgi:hypothetical protein
MARASLSFSTAATWRTMAFFGMSGEPTITLGLEDFVFADVAGAAVFAAGGADFTAGAAADFGAGLAADDEDAEVDAGVDACADEEAADLGGAAGLDGVAGFADGAGSRVSFSGLESVE